MTDLRKIILQQAEIVSAQQYIAASSLSVDQVMASLMERTQRITQADGGVVELIDGDEMVYRAVSGTAGACLGMRIKLDGSLTGLCARENKIVRCDDSELDPRVNKEACRKIQARSMILVPLQRDGEAVGVLKVIAKQPSAFSDSDVTNLQLMAGVMSAALVNASVIEALRQSELELEEKNKLLIQATEIKSQFLANMSHEIRTPLTSILGFADRLLDSDLEASAKNDAALTITRNGQHLLSLINDILDISKLEAGKMKVEAIPCSPIEIAQDVFNALNHKAVEKNVNLQLNLVYPLPKTFTSDPTRLRQILLNLVSNAVKFTDAGHVALKLEYCRLKERLCFDIQDTGIGMSAEQVEQLFRPFAQADASTTRRFGGTGLGLAISHELTSLLGGKITVNSSPSIGTQFSVELPAKVSADELIFKAVLTKEFRASQKEIGKLSGSVLLAEDSEDIASVVTYLVNKTGAQVEVVSNGEEAVAAASAKQFDLILMDMQMPILDGYSATRMLREKGYKLPILALTANTIDSGIRKCLEVGCTDVMGKPFERTEFFNKLAKFLTKSEQSLSAPECDDSNVDPRFLKIRDSFLMKLPQRIANITMWAENSDWAKIGAEVHKLAGSGLVGFNDIASLAKQIEGLVNSPQPEKSQQQIKALISVCNSYQVR